MSDTCSSAGAISRGKHLPTRAAIQLPTAAPSDIGNVLAPKGGKTIHELRKKVWSQSISSGHLDKQKQGILAALKKHNPYRHAKVQACNSKHRCNDQVCPTCSNPKRSANRVLQDGHQTVSGVAGHYRTAGGFTAKNYQVAGGSRMAKPFVGLPLILIHPVTINLGMVEVTGNLKIVAKIFRKRLQKLFRKDFPDGIVRGKFDLAFKWGDELSFGISDDGLPDELTDSTPPHRRFAMFHVHLAVFDPHKSRKQVRDILAKEFSGEKRVRVDYARDDLVRSDGTVTNGIQGYLEYASLEKIELDFGYASYDAALEWLVLNETWTRPNRNLSFGKRTEQTVDLIDPERVAELELAYAEKKQQNNLVRHNYELRKRLDKASVDADWACQFPDQLVLTGSSYLKAARSHLTAFKIRCYYQYSKHFIAYLILSISYIICNSSSQASPRNPCFAGFQRQSPVQFCGRTIQGRSP